MNISILTAILVMFYTCKKEEPDNPTNNKTTAVFNPDITYSSMTDQDGNTYKIVTIGTQTWMAENLRTTKYNDGTAIPNATDDDEWEDLTTAAYCNYNNTTSVDTIATFGRLYNWYAVNTDKLAPTGWHVPIDDEWTTLIDYLGGEDVAGRKLKETETAHWASTDDGVTNETGFTALPGGLRFILGVSFSSIGVGGYWWSATEDGTPSAWNRSMLYYGSVGRHDHNKEIGFSVRCVRD